MITSQQIKQAITHLRLHFSLLLLPVFLFAASQAADFSSTNFIVIFIVLHLLVYPASNAYNSYHDRDIGSIGGLKNPPPVNELVRLIANGLDTVAILISLLAISSQFAAMLFIYIAMSRLYSHRKIRIKKYALPAFLTVFIFQGAWTYAMTIVGLGGTLPNLSIYALMATSFQIGAVYPLTQIFQHNSDVADDVKSLSYRLGYSGTFIFSGLMFTGALIFYYLHFGLNAVDSFFILLAFQVPVIIFFSGWAFKVLNDHSSANYQNTMRMSIISSVSMNLCFLILLILK